MLPFDGGSAFPIGADVDDHQRGLSARDWFATFAPEPTKIDIEVELQSDRIRNPHNEAHKPARRSLARIIADLKYQYADAMLQARTGEKVK